MKKYTFKFTGRQAGAIGILHPVTDSYQCKDIHEAMSYLYEDYDHIRGLNITCNSKQVEQPHTIHWVKVRSNSERPRKADRATYA